MEPDKETSDSSAANADGTSRSFGSTTRADERPHSLDLGAAVAAGTLIATVTYLLLNSAYLEFYGSLGVRPEDVGLDRLAVLGRASGVFVFLLMLSSFLAMAVLIAVVMARSGTFLGGPAAIQIQVWPLLEAAFPLIWRRLRKPLFLSIGVIASVLLAAAAGLATVAVGVRAERAELGRSVDPVALGPLIFVDVKADPARAAWLDKDVPMPPLLGDPWLLYMGQNSQVSVFLACGRTVILPAGKVVPVVLTTKTDRDNERGPKAAREAECERLRTISG